MSTDPKPDVELETWHLATSQLITKGLCALAPAEALRVATILRTNDFDFVVEANLGSGQPSVTVRLEYGGAGLEPVTVLHWKSPGPGPTIN